MIIISVYNDYEVLWTTFIPIRFMDFLWDTIQNFPRRGFHFHDFVFNMFLMNLMDFIESPHFKGNIILLIVPNLSNNP